MDELLRGMAACRLGRLGSTARGAIPALIGALADWTPVDEPLCRENRRRSGSRWSETSVGKQAAIALAEIGRVSLDPLIDALSSEQVDRVG